MTTREKILLSLLILNQRSSYSKVFGFLTPGYKRENLFGILRRMEQDGQVKRSSKFAFGGKGRKTKPTLTMLSKGLARLESKFGPRIRQLQVTSYQLQDDQKPASRFLVIYDFPSPKAYQRGKLKQRLTELGFGRLRRGVYISFYDLLKPVAEWAEEQGILGNVVLLRSDPSLHEGRGRTFLEKAWKLQGLAQDYLSILNRINIARGHQLPDKRASSLRRIKSDFLELVVKDPLLPKNLLPNDWPFNTAKKQILII